MRIKGSHLLIGVTGSIAAYKSALLVRELVKAGAEVRVIMTPSACEFITPLTLATLSRSGVVVEMFQRTGSEGTWHIHLATWADAMIIAPASANTIAKIAHGFADNALTALVLALRCPLIVSPAMDMDMYSHPATRANLEILRDRDVVVIEPEEGDLASGLSGPGRLPDTDTLLAAIEQALSNPSQDLAGVSVLVTAGPTYEAIDPVRYLGNRSSGKMGFAIADAAAARGADVTLVAGPVALETPSRVRRIDVTNAEEMYAAVIEHEPACDLVVMAAAVADYRVAETSSEKLKKDSTSDPWALSLVRNTDILSTLGGRKDDRVLVGFALETTNGIENALKKAREKNADLIVLNPVGVPGAGLGAEFNLATFVFPDGRIEEQSMMSKRHLAERILDRAKEILSNR